MSDGTERERPQDRILYFLGILQNSPECPMEEKRGSCLRDKFKSRRIDNGFEHNRESATWIIARNDELIPFTNRRGRGID